MTNPILDRVAKAIEEAPRFAYQREGTRWVVYQYGHLIGLHVADYSSQGEALHAVGVLDGQSRARAAIEALEEPSEEMVEAAFESFYNAPRHEIRDAYRAMLSVVLK